MEQTLKKIEELVSLMSFAEVKINFDENYRKISIVTEDELVQSQISHFLPALEHIINLILRKDNLPSAVVDINYYRKERERLITELAKAAAHKARITKEEVELPQMNAYERRLVHVEIAAHPELKTESVGFGKDRRVIIKHIDFNSVKADTASHPDGL